MITKDIITLDFTTSNIPLPIESRNTSDSTYVTWGLNNQYPNFLLELYSQSAIHSAIVNQKTTYILGDGLKSVDGKDLDVSVNGNDNIKEFTSKITKDYLLFNAMAVEVVFNVFGKPIEFHHVPVHKIRMNKLATKFWYNDDWIYNRKQIIYDRYSVKKNDDATSKIFYFDGYFPSIHNTYPQPEYNGTIKSITTDIAIKEFNLNNIKNQFSPSTIITFFNGANVSEEVKRQIIVDIETKFKGERGKKFIVDFQTKDGKSAEINQLSANDWDKAYLQVAENNIADILVGHQVQNPSLFAIQNAGKLGNTQELEVSYEIFKNNYINVKRDEIESALNQLFTNFEAINGRVKFADKALFNTSLKDEVKVQVFTINELRNIAGLPPLADGDKLLSQAATQPSLPTPAPLPVQQEEEVKKKGHRQLSIDDYDLVKHLGTSFDEFDEAFTALEFDKESDVANYIISNDIRGLTLPELKDVLASEGNISIGIKDLQNVLNKLTSSGVITVDTDKDGRIKITPSNIGNVPDTNIVETYYQYVLRPEASGSEIIDGTRSFCRAIIEGKKYFSRSDIQEMSNIFGYDIFEHTGGWWYNPDTDTTYNHCRHKFKQVKVVKKKR